MLIAFIDESYELSPAGDIYVVAAIVCDGHQLAELETELDACVEQASKSYGVPSAAELHGYEIFHGSADWSAVAGMTRARIGIYASAFTAIAASGTHVFTSSTRPSRLTMDPHRLSLRYLLENLDRHAEAVDDYVVVICDDLDGRHLHRHSLDHYRKFSTGGYKPRQIRRTLDTMHFGDSNESRGLQAADLVAFLRRRMERSTPGSKAETHANQEIWTRLDFDRYHPKSWYPW